MDNLEFDFFCKGCQESAEYRLKNCFAKVKKRTFERGEFIVMKGARVGELTQLVLGTIKVRFLLPSGVVLREMTHRAPYPIGALALLGGENRYRVEVEAVDNCKTLSVSRVQVEDRVMNCRRFMLNFIGYTTSKIDMVTEHLALLSQRGIRAKIAYYIFTILQADGVSFRFEKSIQQLADFLCVERPSLSRVLSQLTKEGRIVYSNGRGQVVDLARLNDELNC